MEQQKILFADLCRLIGAIKDELKDTGKDIEKLLVGGDWEGISILVNSIIAEAQLITRLSAAMIENADLFLSNGPYEGQSDGMLPLESYAHRDAM